MAKLKGFTCSPRPIDPCPHGCGKWARELTEKGQAGIKDDAGHTHNVRCPAVNQGCRYCGYNGPSSPIEKHWKDGLDYTYCGSCNIGERSY